MLAEERKAYILQKLKEQGLVQSQDIMSALNVSESTVRRDLIELEKDGRLERIHGGARLGNRLIEEYSLKEKKVLLQKEKAAIAGYAAALLEEGEVIFLDAGTTCLEMIDFMKDRSLRVVTNSVEAAHKLQDKEITTLVLGGYVKLSTGAVIGASAQDQLRNYRFHKAFIGINGIMPSSALTTPDTEEAAIKRLAIRQARETFILADYSKFNKESFCKVADFNDVTAIITNPLSEEVRSQYQDLVKIEEV